MRKPHETNRCSQLMICPPTKLSLLRFQRREEEWLSTSDDLPTPSASMSTENPEPCWDSC